MKTLKALFSVAIALCVATSISAQPNYDYSRLQREKLGRGVVAVRENPSEVALSWRYLSSDPIQTTFNIYRNGQKIAEVPASTGTFYRDNYPTDSEACYTVKAVVDGVEQEQLAGQYTLPANAPIGYIDIPLQKPADGVTPAGDSYSYGANDASIGDVDGDGEYEIILKWNPSNAHDNAHDGYTGNVLFDCYRLTGELLWRIDLGHNVRAGAHYTQFMVFDLDGDNRAEVVMKTSDGTVDGTGKVIGDASADYREKGFTSAEFPGRTPRNQGRILTGNEYLTVFNGLTGAAMKTIDYAPTRGNLADWGDTRANRSDRFLACVAYLDGVHPSVVMCRGYYTRTVLAAFDWDGKELKERWIFDSNTAGNEDYAGQGNHNLRVGDVDGDGCDEIIYGSCAIDHNGKGLYSTRMGHGFVMEVTGERMPADVQLCWAFGACDGVERTPADNLIPTASCFHNVHSIEGNAFTTYYGASMRLRVTQGVAPLKSELRLADGHRQSSPLKLYHSGKKTDAPVIAALTPWQASEKCYFSIYQRADLNYYMLPKVFEEAAQNAR
ncbi:MAG: DUF4450 domain-containing protein [Alistipes sp.]|nr:DUF4450 domain-containing protein [Alistipes sp.]